MNANPVFARPRAARGFTLLEVLVAFSILSLSLGVLIQIFGSGLHRTALAEEYTLATLHAESLLARFGVEEPLEIGETGGEIDERYRWRALVEEFVDEADQDSGLAGGGLAGGGLAGDGLIGELGSGLGAQPYRLVLTVHWGGDGTAERSVSLQTLRLVAEDDF